MIIRGRSAGLSLFVCLVAGCSSGGSGAMGTGGGGGTSLPATGGTGGAGRADAGRDAGPQPDGGSSQAFWCSDYRQAQALAGWVQIQVTVSGVGFGGMTSPIQACHASASDWSVSASGIEADGVDQTTMAFGIAGAYHGPGRYQGTVAQGMTGAISHSNLGSFTFSTVAASDCAFCINADGLSGTVSCWDLEPPAGASTEIAYVQQGSFTCPGAASKPADAPTDPAPSAGLGGVPSGAVLCHYLAKLNCPGRPLDATCVQHSDGIAFNGPCPDPWINWLACAEAQPSSDFTCGDGDDLVMASGACATELAALRACRAGH